MATETNYMFETDGKMYLAKIHAESTQGVDGADDIAEVIERELDAEWLERRASTHSFLQALSAHTAGLFNSSLHDAIYQAAGEIEDRERRNWADRDSEIGICVALRFSQIVNV